MLVVLRVPALCCVVLRGAACSAACLLYHVVVS